jgi:hypothetical protein
MNSGILREIRETVRRVAERCRKSGNCLEAFVELFASSTIMDLRQTAFAAGEYGVNVELAVLSQIVAEAEILLRLLDMVGGVSCEAAELYVKVMERVFSWMEEEGLLTGPRWPFFAWVYSVEERYGCRYLGEGDREALRRLFEEGYAVAEYLTVKLLVQAAKVQGAALISYNFVVKKR